jgi:hypothetical protein
VEHLQDPGIIIPIDEGLIETIKTRENECYEEITKLMNSISEGLHEGKV